MRPLSPPFPPVAAARPEDTRHGATSLLYDASMGRCVAPRWMPPLPWLRAIATRATPAEFQPESTCHFWHQHKATAPRIATMLALGATSDSLATVQPFQDDPGHTANGSDALQHAPGHTNGDVLVPVAAANSHRHVETFGEGEVTEMEPNLTRHNAVRAPFKPPTRRPRVLHMD